MQLKNAGEKGFFITDHSVCNNCETNDTWKWIQGRSAHTKLCWEITARVNGATVLQKSFTCEYPVGEPQEENCRSEPSPNDRDANVTRKLYFVSLFKFCHVFPISFSCKG